MNTQQRHEILFIDFNISDQKSLIDGLASDIEIVLLDNKTNVINQIAAALDGRQNLDAIHIVSHGAASELAFANGALNNENVSDYATQLKRIGSALSANGDLLLYGCNVAKGDDGVAFINTLANLTGADVAASDNLTGKSGDWVLETTIDDIETKEVFSDAYAYELSSSTISTKKIGNGTLTITSKIEPFSEIQNDFAFAIIKSDGSIVTWGDPNSGGDSSVVDSQLDGTIGVTQIFSTSTAFAAFREDGSVVTWGDPNSGGDSSVVDSQLDGTIRVTQIFSTNTAFAALREDGSVVTWGNSNAGGDSGSVENQLNGSIDVMTIATGVGSFAALRADGSVVTWGDFKNGGDSGFVESGLDGTIDVKQVFSTGTTFVALRADGSIVNWGNDILAFSEEDVRNGAQIFSTSTAFAILRVDGSVVTGGEDAFGGDSSAVYIQLNGNVDVTQICSNNGAFAALRTDGSVVTWGDYTYGGDSNNVANQLNGNIDITRIFSTEYGAFAALRADGAVVTWGDSFFGGDSSAVNNQLNGSIDVTQIYSNSGAFAALRVDGSVITWGDENVGGDSSAVASQLNGNIAVSQIFSTKYGAFAALRVDGSVVTWGDSVGGGDSAAVANQLQSGVVSYANVATNDIYSINHNPTGNVNISGTAQQNQTLSASNTLADTDGLGTINYQWLSNGNVISGADQTNYTLTQTDVGKAITVRASYTDGLGKLESVTSIPTSPVVNVNDLSSGSVTISGEAKQGRTLTASHNLVDIDGLGTITYQWLRNSEIISNANNSNYTLTQADANQSLSVKAYYTDGQGTRESVNSSSLTIAGSNSLSVSSPSVSEGDSGQTNLTFTLTLSQALHQSGSIDYTLQSGTATSGVDFTATSGTVQFNAGETSKTITVPVLGDTTIENDEIFNLVLSNPRILELSNGLTSMTATGTIRNDDFPILTIANLPSIQEGNSGQSNLNFTVQLSDAPLSAVSVDYATKGLTATAGQDFTAQTATLKFAAGEKEKTISVPVLGDTTQETDETLSLVLSNLQNAKFANNVNELRSTGTILNDDSQTVRLNSPSVIEGDSGVTYLKFLISLGYTVNSDVTFDYKIEDGTATLNTDYAVTTNTVTLPAGQQSIEISIPVSGDTRIEPNETLKLTINSATGITLPNNMLPISSIGTIINDDLPLVSILAAKTTYEPAIGFKNIDIPVTLSATASTDIIISYHTEGATATQDKDFLNSSAKLTIPANANTGIISVPINADSEKEPDETFKVIIDKVDGGAKLSTGQSSLTSEVTISAISLPVFAVQDVALQEGDSGNKNLTFKVNLSDASTLPVTFSVKTTDKTATAGLDYLALNSVTKTIPVGSQSLEITLPIVGDKVSESDETFNLVFSNITNAVFDNGNETFSATGTIIDDDKPIIRIDDVHILEGDQGFHTENIKVTLSMPAVNPVKVHYALLDGTAKGGEDFVTSEDDLIIPAGAKEAYIPVAIQGDKIPEAAQDFHIQLSNPSNAQFLDLALTTQNTVTIDSDDGDTLPILSVGKNLAIDEGDTGLTSFPITLTLSKPATDTLSIKYQTIGIDAMAESDFISTSGTLTFLAGDTNKAINISIYGDTEVESDEDFTLSLTDPQGMRFSNGFPTQDLTLLIRDDDAEPVQNLQGTAKNDILDATKAGGTGDDILDGLKGIDTMIGGDGNDIYYVDNIKDSIVEGDQSQSNAGDDDLVHSIAASYILPANVEHLIINGKLKGNGTGNVLDNKLTGNLAVNVLSGLAGNDTLDGGSGNDTLIGGDGNDTFVFSQGIKGNKNIDTVKDFVHGQDKIYLSSDIFSKLASAAGFVTGSEPMSLAKADSHYLVSAVKVKAVDVNSYLLYDTATGRLSYDEDGSGKLVASSFVTLTGKPILTLDDFYIS